MPTQLVTLYLAWSTVGVFLSLVNLILRENQSRYSIPVPISVLCTMIAQEDGQEGEGVVKQITHQLRRSAGSFLCMLVAYWATAAGLVDAQESKTCLDGNTTEQRFSNVRAKVSNSIVLGNYRTTEDRSTFSIGVIASPGGHVLLRGPVPAGEIKIQLADGGVATAKKINWSVDHGFGWAKIQSDRVWPHVSIEGTDSPTIGTPLAVFGFPVNKKDQKYFHGPFASLEFVDSVAKNHWFMTDGTKLDWCTSPVAFDLSGRFVGLAMFSSGFRRFGWGFTDANEISSALDLIKANANVDLEPIGNNKRNSSREEISNEARKRAIGASVRIRRKTSLKTNVLNQQQVSGTVISQDGLIATCGHHWFMPGTSVRVSFSDGRNMEGTVVGFRFPGDVGLVKTNSTGPFQHVEFGKTTGVRAGDNCFAVGYGGLDDSVPLPNLYEAVIRQPKPQSTYALFSSSKLVGGDSGGGLFDHRGRLIGIHTRSIADHSIHSRVDLFAKHSKSLKASFLQKARPRETQIEKVLLSQMQSSSASVVQIVDKGKVVALGTAVAKNGLVVSKLSALPAKPRCQLSDGSIVSCQVVKRVREHDIAVLQVEHDSMPFIAVAESVGDEEGKFVVAETGDPSPLIGYVSKGLHTIDREPGFLRVTLNDGKNGVEVSEAIEFAAFDRVQKLSPNMLKKGDVLVSIEDRPIATTEACFDLLSSDIEGIGVTSGDMVRLDIIREGKPMTVSQILAPTQFPHPESQSLRSSGFRTALSVAIHSELALCGGPVMDKRGCLMGIGIAFHRSGCLLVLPCKVLAEVLASIQ